jgi:outer membrane protein assembly factor BamB
MDCEKVIKDLENYLLDRLNEKKYAEVTEHINSCISCAEAIQEKRNHILNEEGMCVHPAVRPEFREKLLASIHSEIKSIKPKNSFFIGARLIAAAVAVLAVGTAFFFLFTNTPVIQKTDIETPICVWEYKGISSLNKSSFDIPAAAGSKVFVLQKRISRYFIVALNAETGEVLWESPESVYGYLTTDGKHVVSIFITPDRQTGLKCFDALTGSHQWTFVPKETVTVLSTPEISPQGICWNGGSILYMINTHSGGKKWSSSFPDRTPVSKPFIHGTSVWVMAGNTLYRVDAENGDIKQSRFFKDLLPSSIRPPLLAGSPSSLCIISFNEKGESKKLTCIDTGSLNIAWDKDVHEVCHLQIIKDMVILRSGTVYAFSLQNNGGLLWQYESSGCSPVSSDDDRLYFFNTQGDPSLIVLDPETGSSVGTFPLPSSCAGIAVKGKHGYINAKNGVLYAYTL